jgi:hypothetical protein
MGSRCNQGWQEALVTQRCDLSDDRIDALELDGAWSCAEVVRMRSGIYTSRSFADHHFIGQPLGTTFLRG